MPDQDPIAMHDQARAELVPIAGTVAAYYQALLRGGVPSDIAGGLTLHFQQVVFSRDAEDA